MIFFRKTPKNNCLFKKIPIFAFRVINVDEGKRFSIAVINGDLNDLKGMTGYGYVLLAYQ